MLTFTAQMVLQHRCVLEEQHTALKYTLFSAKFFQLHQINHSYTLIAVWLERRVNADVLALSHSLIPLGWVGAGHWLLADKNNFLTIFNSCLLIGVAYILACCQDLQRLCQDSTISLIFFFSLKSWEKTALTNHHYKLHQSHLQLK